MNEIKAPECEKLSALRREVVALTNFFTWLDDEGIGFSKTTDSGHLFSHIERPERMIYRCLGIDAAKLEKERSAMLAALAQEPTR